MHTQLLSPKSPLPTNGLRSRSFLPTSPKPLFSLFSSNSSKTQNNRVVNCRGIEVSVLSSCSNSLNSSNNGSLGSLRLNVKDVDIATLGNLCVDIVLNVPELPPEPLYERKAYMERLASSPPDKKYWEAGGHCNTAIAAARLGLRCTAIGHVGNDIYGRFLLDVLCDEEIGFVKMSDIPDSTHNASSAHETLLCWVLVDPLQRHGFCSRADFNEEPAFNWMNGLKSDVKLAIKKSKILVINGYGFDELPPGLIVSALKYAVDVGTCVFFDPGPRGKSLSIGTPEEQMALSELLKMSDVLLLTFDEV
uniref:Fructokinase n=1 Tax=Opuntia streptacantha TaxID=393608 RepID=A0A7C9A5P7_OPUST